MRFLMPFHIWTTCDTMKGVNKRVGKEVLFEGMLER